MTPIKRIAINTGGGDAPGLNAVIQSAVYAARAREWEVLGVREGYNGILEPQRFRNGGLLPLDCDDVRQIAHLGGTILGTTNRGNPFRAVRQQSDGSKIEIDRSNDVIENFRKRGIDALIAVGGDGSLAI